MGSNLLVGQRVCLLGYKPVLPNIVIKKIKKINPY